MLLFLPPFRPPTPRPLINPRSCQQEVVRIPIWPVNPAQMEILWGNKWCIVVSEKHTEHNEETLAQNGIDKESKKEKHNKWNSWYESCFDSFWYSDTYYRNVV